jgi:hypothetical protein
MRRTKLSNVVFQGETRESDLRTLYQQSIDDRGRCRALRISADDMVRLVSEFAALHGGITQCPPAYAALSRQYGL